MKHRIVLAMFVVPLSVLLAACEPEVGSEAWCEQLAEKPKGEWTFNESADYARHCVLR